jgi:2-haloacid dehalogenase
MLIVQPRLTREILGDKWQDVAELWRTKQLQYTWLRSLAGRHANFWQVTGDALDFVLDSLKLANPKVREELMDLYLRLSAYPEVKNVLAQLKARGFKCPILSNGSPNMLTSAIENAGIQIKACWMRFYRSKMCKYTSHILQFIN